MLIQKVETINTNTGSLRAYFRLERWAGILIGLIVAGTVLRFIHPIWENPVDYLFSDPQRHWDNAKQIWKPGFMSASDPFLYQLYLYFLREGFNDNRYAIGVMTGLLSAVMPFTYYIAARRFGFGRIASLSVWALMAWTPSFISIYHVFMIETLLLPLAGLGLWTSARHLHSGEMLDYLFSVIAWTAAVLTKAIVGPLAAVFLIYGWLARSRKMKEAVIGLLIALTMLAPNAIRAYPALGFLAPFGSPWIVRLYFQSDVKTIVIQSPTESWFFSNPVCYQNVLAPFSDWAVERSKHDTVLRVSYDPAHGQDDWIKAAKSYQFGFAEWARLAKENLVLFLFNESWPDNPSDRLTGVLQIWFRFMWAPVIVLVLAGNAQRFARRDLHIIPLATTAFVLFMLLQPFGIVEGRYRKPVEPLLLMNLVYLATQWRGGRSLSGAAPAEAKTDSDSDVEKLFGVP